MKMTREQVQVGMMISAIQIALAGPEPFEKGDPGQALDAVMKRCNQAMITIITNVTNLALNCDKTTPQEKLKVAEEALAEPYAIIREMAEAMIPFSERLEAIAAGNAPVDLSKFFKSEPG